MDSFFSTIESYLSLLLEPTVALLIGILSIWISKNSNIYNASLERLTNAYHPIFLIAEPYLFKKINKASAQKFIEDFGKINEDFSLYIYPSLRYRVQLLATLLETNCNQSTIDEEWEIICQYINKDYDNLCKKTHMPIRSAAYRLNNSQFETKTSLYWGLFKLFGLPLIVFIIFSYLMIIYASTLTF